MSSDLGEITKCYTVVFKRSSKHPAQRLWSAITEADEIAKWIQQLKSFLLRRGLRSPKRAQGWSQPYENWVCSRSLDQPAAQEALDQMIASRQTRHAQLTALDRRIAELAE